MSGKYDRQIDKDIQLLLDKASIAKFTDKAFNNCWSSDVSLGEGDHVKPPTFKISLENDVKAPVESICTSSNTPRDNILYHVHKKTFKENDKNRTTTKTPRLNTETRIKSHLLPKQEVRKRNSSAKYAKQSKITLNKPIPSVRSAKQLLSSELKPSRRAVSLDRLNDQPQTSNKQTFTLQERQKNH